MNVVMDFEEEDGISKLFLFEGSSLCTMVKVIPGLKYSQEYDVVLLF